MIARYAPGLGDPWRLPVDQWFGALKAIGNMLRRESGSGGSSARSQVEADMRAMYG